MKNVDKRFFSLESLETYTSAVFRDLVEQRRHIGSDTSRDGGILVV